MDQTVKRQKRKKTIPFLFGQKHLDYIRSCRDNLFNIAEGAVRAGKTVDNIFAFANELKRTPDKIHLATGSTMANAKMNIGDANGFGLEHIFRGQCHWGKYRDNEALYIRGEATRGRLRIVIFAGGAKKDSYKKIRGNSYGMWIATEINLHHSKTITEAFNRQLAAKKRVVFWDLNPDNPKAPIYTEYIDKYIEKSSKGELLGGCNYQHFTIEDNATISEERRAEIKSQYDPKSIWYMRDILGMRVIASGLVYRQLASDVATNQIENYELFEPPKNLRKITLGVDFGGSGSGHSFTASGISQRNELIALKSEWIKCRDEHIDPERLGLLFCDFVKSVVHTYGYVDYVYCDNAEQVLIEGLRISAKKEGLPWLRILDALKEPINERINVMNRLIAQGRFKYVKGQCDSLLSALCNAVWNPKNLTEDERLDDGTTDIDSLDSFEYSYERDIIDLIRVERRY